MSCVVVVSAGLRPVVAPGRGAWGQRPHQPLHSSAAGLRSRPRPWSGACRVQQPRRQWDEVEAGGPSTSSRAEAQADAAGPLPRPAADEQQQQVEQQRQQQPKRRQGWQLASSLAGPSGSLSLLSLGAVTGGGLLGALALASWVLGGVGAGRVRAGCVEPPVRTSQLMTGRWLVCLPACLSARLPAHLPSCPPAACWRVLVEELGWRGAPRRPPPFSATPSPAPPTPHPALPHPTRPDLLLARTPPHTRSRLRL